jgi:hypothetical protein
MRHWLMAGLVMTAASCHLPDPRCVPFHCDPHPTVHPSVPRPGKADLVHAGQSPGRWGTDG